MANFKLSDLQEAKTLDNSAMVMVVQGGKNYRTSINDIVKKASGADLSDIEDKLEAIDKNAESINTINDKLTALNNQLGALSSVVINPEESENIIDELISAKPGATITTSSDTVISYPEYGIEQSLNAGSIYQKVETSEIMETEFNGESITVPVISNSDGSKTIIFPDGSAQTIKPENVVPEKITNIETSIVIIKEVEILPSSIETEHINSLMSSLSW